MTRKRKPPRTVEEGLRRLEKHDEQDGWVLVREHRRTGMGVWQVSSKEDMKWEVSDYIYEARSALGAARKACKAEKA